MNTIAAFLIGSFLLLPGVLILLMCVVGSTQESQMGKFSRIAGSLIGIFLILMGIGIVSPVLLSVSP
jgi:hypothetical protein